MMEHIYFDHNATTPVADEVQQIMMRWLTNAPGFGNASRPHWAGLPAKAAIAEATALAAKIIGAQPEEMIITSGGSESVNHAIKGVYFAFMREPGAKHVITSAIEHPAALEACRFLQSHFDVDVTEIPVDEHCMVDPKAIEQAIRPETILINLMFSNHETGAIQPVQEVAAIAQRNNVLFHVDATSAVGKNHVDVADIGCDLLSYSAHKFYGPKGIGALWVGQKLRNGLQGKNNTIEFVPLIHGSAPKQTYRSGTAVVPSIVGLGKACELSINRNTPAYREKLRGLTVAFWQALHSQLGDVVQLISPADHSARTCNTICIAFRGFDGEELLAQLPRIAASSGAKTAEISRQIGKSDALAKGAIRFSFGKSNTIEEVNAAVTDIISVIRP